MIHSKPNYSTVFSILIFLAIVLSSFFVLLNSLLTSPDYFIIKLILAPTLLVVAFIIWNRLMKGFKHIRLGDMKFEVVQAITRSKEIYKVSEIKGWQEEVVKGKAGEYRETNILFEDHKTLRISNKETSQYPKIIAYLRQKVAKKELKAEAKK